VVHKATPENNHDGTTVTNAVQNLVFVVLVVV
jgi:hypothetical protein